MTLNLTTTREIASRDRLRCFIYGLPGSGKTHLAGTFPAPLFIVPEKIAEELRTCGNTHLTAATFDTAQGFLDTSHEIGNILKAGKKIGHYRPQTIVVDSITEIQNMIEHEILVRRWKDQGETGDFPMMTNRDWGIMYNLLMTSRNLLYGIPKTHVIWIGHAKQNEGWITEGKTRKLRTTKEVILRGDAKNFIPNSCNVLSYLECKPLGQNPDGSPKTSYYMYGQPYNGWNSRVHLPADQAGFIRLGGESSPEAPRPSYDELASYFDLPPAKQCEEGIKFEAITPIRGKGDATENQGLVKLTSDKEQTKPKRKQLNEKVKK